MLDVASVRCWFSVVLPQRDFARVLGFSSLHKNQYSKFQFDLKTVDRKSHSWNVRFILNNRTGAYSRKSGIWIPDFGYFKVVSIREMKATVRRKF